VQLPRYAVFFPRCHAFAPPRRLATCSQTMSNVTESAKGSEKSTLLALPTGWVLPAHWLEPLGLTESRSPSPSWETVG
jgi:hypothetical protein